MYKIFYLIAFIFIIEKANNYVYWNERSKLQFSDFTGAVTDTYAAMSDVQIDINFHNESNELIFSAYTYFIKDSSYMDIDSDYLLNHEQLHFDIREFNARTIRKFFYTVNKYDEFNIINDINSIYKNGILLDSIYDAETVHGTNISMQNIWNIKIKKKLDSLKSYENPVGMVILK